MLISLACSNNTDGTPATDSTIVDQLRENAEVFEYATGATGRDSVALDYWRAADFESDHCERRPVVGHPELPV